MAERSEKNEAGTKDVDAKPRDLKSSVSIVKKKDFSSKRLHSRVSLKKFVSMSQTSNLSESSLVMKRQSEFDRIAKAPRYQNTYRLDSKYPFNADEVNKLIAEIVERSVSDFPQYDTVLMPKLVQLISAEVRSSVKLLGYDRYKICVLVMIGEKKLDGFQAAFRALWDPERDSWASHFYQCRTYFVSCICFGLYHD